MPVTHAVSIESDARCRVRGRLRADANPSMSRRAPRASFGTYVLGIALITAALTLFVYFRVSSLRLGYIITQQRHEQLQLVLENRALKTEIGTLTSPSRIRTYAVEKLGMVPAEKFVDLGRSGR